MTFDSSVYWTERYCNGGNSGAGSYAHLAAYKASFINDFVRDNKVQNVVELGCGDGHQLSLAYYPKYTGFDVASHAVEHCAKLFAGDPDKQFFHTDVLKESRNGSFSADLALSLDVLFHLVEEDVYQQYMRDLFSLARKYVIIYAAHSSFSTSPHVKSRSFLQDIDYGTWNIVNSLDNPFPYDAEHPDTTSFARFYVFCRKEIGAVVPSAAGKGLYSLGKDDADCFQYIKDGLVSDSLHRANPITLVTNYVAKSCNIRLLDVGCGRGESFQELTDTGLQIDWTGCDIEDSDEVNARSISDSEQHFVTFDGVHLPFPDNSFDVVFSRQVFEHVESPEALLQEIARVLKPEGFCIGSVSQLEPYHSRSYGNMTTYGFTALVHKAQLNLERFALGPDAFTLLQRRLDGRNSSYGARFDPHTSAVYNAIERADREIGEDARITLYKQLLCAGAFSFVVSKQKQNKRFDQEYAFVKIHEGIAYVDAQAFQRDYSKNCESLSPLVGERKEPLIVSLTSFPERIHRVHMTIYSILQQLIRPDRLLLWLAHDEFPQGEADLPQDLLALKAYGLDIRFCENIRSYKKIIPTLQAFPEDVIVTADDDVYYPRDWLKKLYLAYREQPSVIHGHRVHQLSCTSEGNVLPYAQWKYCLSYTENNASFKQLITGAGGALWPRGALHEMVTDVQAFLRLAPHADDLWLWAMAVLNGTKIHIPKDNKAFIITTFPERDFGLELGFTLYTENGPGGGNDKQLANLLAAYPQLASVLREELTSQSS